VSNTLFCNDKVFVLDSKTLSKLKSLALKHPFKRARICLHKDRNDFVQEMIIVAHHDSVVHTHKHPKNRPESYHIIEGELLVKIYNDNAKVIQEVLLHSNNEPRMYRIEGNIWHQPIPTSEWVVYHEVFTGPFDKNCDVIYQQK